MMIYIGVLIIVAAAPIVEQPIVHRSYANMYAQEAQATEELRRTSHSITCDRCGWTGYGYRSPGRAKMGLSGHQKSCRKV